MINKNQIYFMIGLFFLIILAGCNTNLNMINPASKYCNDQGGTLIIRTNVNGSQSGFCKFDNGKECDEWKYYNGYCNEAYDVAEFTNNKCSIDSDCKTPMEYLVRSNCPYTSKCIKDNCAVVCPGFGNGAYYDVRECGECPKFMPPGPNFCEDGNIVSGEIDECGCIGTPKCEMNNKINRN